MKQLIRYGAAAAAGALVATSIVYAQAPAAPPRALVALYHAAPGHQVELLKWLAQQDRVAQAAGVAPTQLYAHTDGDSWDYMGINPVTTEAQDSAMDAEAKKMGLPSGLGGLEFRKHITSHTDTMTVGPMTASQYLAYIGK